MMFIFYFFLVFCIICVPRCQGKTIKKAQANLVETTPDPWQGKWFPYAPGESHIIRDKVQRVLVTKPPPIKDSWTGSWFPYAPGEPHIIKDVVPRKLSIQICDNGKENLAIDYDPQSVLHNFNYLCISSNRSDYEPKISRKALITEHFLPPAYLPPMKCLNESINYSHYPPTNGAFRPLASAYGTYKYLPPQRYVRNLAEGAIVMLYHPCADESQVEQLQQMVRACLYRHIITPSTWLTPERPLALLSWGRSLSMSVVSKTLVNKFILDHAKSGPLVLPNLSRIVEKRNTYYADLVVEARLVTDLDDTELCGYQEM